LAYFKAAFASIFSPESVLQGVEGVGRLSAAACGAAETITGCASYKPDAVKSSHYSHAHARVKAFASLARSKKTGASEVFGINLSRTLFSPFPALKK
jgi:hypothetical protein